MKNLDTNQFQFVCGGHSLTPQAFLVMVSIIVVQEYYKKSIFDKGYKAGYADGVSGVAPAH